MNPFSDALSVANSRYSIFDGHELVNAETGCVTSPLSHFVHGAFRALVLNEYFTCLGGKSSIRQGTYRFGLYPELGSEASTAGLARDLFTFVGEMPGFGDAFSTYVASFEGPPQADEAAFEAALWRTLQQLNERDSGFHRWDPTVSDNPDDPQFSFSFAGVAFFVVGMHAASSRVARRFAWPTLVFNAHRQFERLRAHGDYTRFQRLMRDRDERLQGAPNPMTADFGTRSEAAQYSGRHVGSDWKCPFHAAPGEDVEEAEDADHATAD